MRTLYLQVFSTGKGAFFCPTQRMTKEELSPLCQILEEDRSCDPTHAVSRQPIGIQLDTDLNEVNDTELCGEQVIMCRVWNREEVSRVTVRFQQGTDHPEWYSSVKDTGVCSDIPVSDSAVRSDIPVLNTVRCVMMPGGRFKLNFI